MHKTCLIQLLYTHKLHTSFLYVHKKGAKTKKINEKTKKIPLTCTTYFQSN